MSPSTGPTGRSALQLPVVYLSCRLDRFVAACGDAHPWVLWRTYKLDELRREKPFDVSWLDVSMPGDLRLGGATGAGRPEEATR